MAESTDPKAAGPTQPEIHLVRDFAVPRALLFQAWSSAEALAQWYAPRGCSLVHPRVDFRPGGEFHHAIRTPGGDCWCKGNYLEIVAPERIVYSLRFSDAAGNEVDTSPVGKDPDWPMETHVTVTFEEIPGGTRLTLHQTAAEALARRTGAYGSWLEMLDLLGETLASAHPRAAE